MITNFIYFIELGLGVVGRVVGIYSTVVEISLAAVTADFWGTDNQLGRWISDLAKRLLGWNRD